MHRPSSHNLTPRRTLRYLSCTLVALLLAACGAADDPGSPSAAPTSANGARSLEVSVAQFRFEPEVVTVAPGTEVTWVNSDRILHTATSGSNTTSDGRFSVDLDGEGSTASVTFDEPGRYDYFCAVHPHMQGTIIVAASP